MANIIRNLNIDYFVNSDLTREKWPAPLASAGLSPTTRSDVDGVRSAGASTLNENNSPMLKSRGALDDLNNTVTF